MQQHSSSDVIVRDIGVVIPFYQTRQGILSRALASAESQSLAQRCVVYVVDDESPFSAADELAQLPAFEHIDVRVIRQKNGGAGKARNTGLDNLDNNIRYVAFLDSDDAWHDNHLEVAISTLEAGYDAYFSDHYAALYPDISNFSRIGTLDVPQHTLLNEHQHSYAMTISMIDHIISDGGGVIGTSNVVYRHHQFPKLRFREEFYNGQDFFFWMDLSDQQAKWCFSTQITCTCGTGLNIYSGSGWGTKNSLRRIRNELFVWTSAERFYTLSPTLKRANAKTINHLQESAVRDILHRIRHLKPISFQQASDIFKMCPSTLALFFTLPFSIVKQKLFR